MHSGATMGNAKTLRDKVRSMVSIDVWCEPEDESIRGSFDSGDAALDEEDVQRIERDLADGNAWAWCTACVRVTLATPRAAVTSSVQYLGACNYASKEEFTVETRDYYEDMIETALDEILATIELDYVPLLRSLGYSVKRGAK